MVVNTVILGVNVDLAITIVVSSGQSGVEIIVVVFRVVGSELVLIVMAFISKSRIGGGSVALTV